MFPDATLKWQSRQSVIDGLKNPTIVDRGFWDGDIHFVVTGTNNEPRLYGISIEPICYAAFDETFYSIAGHGDISEVDFSVYLREAVTSELKRCWSDAYSFDGHDLRHWSLVGLDTCYEVLALEDPRIRQFKSQAEADAWCTPA